MIALDIKHIFTLPPTLKQLDLALFSKVNGQWHNVFFDKFFPFVRESYVWIPFYFFLILFVTINFKSAGWYWVLIFLATVAFSDLFSSRVIKEIFFRLRPCRDPNLADSVRLLASYCGGNSSFTSSHAVNHFALAAFVYNTFKNLSNKWWPIFIWAAVICYAQVYVGVHFPFDVACGACLGYLIGYATARVYHTSMRLSPETRKEI